MFDYIQPHSAEYGNLSTLVTPELTDFCSQHDNIAVGGFTKSGKSVISRTLAFELDRKVIFSDSLMHLDWNEHLDAFIGEAKPFTIVEGVSIPRLLRRGEKSGHYIADVVIWCDCDFETIQKCYDLSGEDYDSDKIYQFNMGMYKIFDEWLDLKPKATVIYIDTSF